MLKKRDNSDGETWKLDHNMNVNTTLKDQETVIMK